MVQTWKKKRGQWEGEEKGFTSSSWKTTPYENLSHNTSRSQIFCKIAKTKLILKSNKSHLFKTISQYCYLRFISLFPNSKTLACKLGSISLKFYTLKRILLQTGDIEPCMQRNQHHKWTPKACHEWYLSTACCGSQTTSRSPISATACPSILFVCD